MPSAQQTVVIGTRTSKQTKAGFAALAAKQGLTQSSFLALLVDQVLDANAPKHTGESWRQARAENPLNDRITLRLRPGDRALAEAKAASRQLKTSSYLAMLVRNHVRNSIAMPPAELEVLRGMAGHLAALGRQLRMVATTLPAAQAADPTSLLLDVGHSVESVREGVARVVRANLSSWEAPEANHA